VVQAPYKCPPHAELPGPQGLAQFPVKFWVNVENYSQHPSSWPLLCPGWTAGRYRYAALRPAAVASVLLLFRLSFRFRRFVVPDRLVIVGRLVVVVEPVVIEFPVIAKTPLLILHSVR
jgi:hypothetical protein